MFNALSPSFKGLLLGLAGYSLFTVSDMLVKFVAPHFSVAQIVACQSLVSIILLLLFSSKLGGLRSMLAGNNIKLHIFRGTLGVGLAFIAAYSFANLPMTTVYTAIFTQPFFAVIFAAIVYKEKTEIKHWIPIILGFVGVLVAFQPWNNTIAPYLLILLLIAPILIAVIYTMMRSLKNPTLFAIGIYPVAIAFIAALPFAWADFQIPEWPHILVFLAMGSIGLMGFLCLSTAYKIAEASTAASSHYIQMIWGVIWGYFIFGDVPSTHMLIGAVIIIASGIYLIMQQKKTKLPAASPNTPSAS